MVFKNKKFFKDFFVIDNVQKKNKKTASTPQCLPHPHADSIKNRFKESRFLHHTAMMAHRCVKKKTEKKAVHKRNFGLRKPTLKNIRPLTEMSLTYAYSANVRKVFHIPKRNDIFF